MSQSGNAVVTVIGDRIFADVQSLSVPANACPQRAVSIRYVKEVA